MDSTTFNIIYSSAVGKFCAAARIISTQELLGNWPIKREASRLLFLYTWALNQSQDPNTPLTDNQILAIGSRVNTLKYE